MIANKTAKKRELNEAAAMALLASIGCRNVRVAPSINGGVDRHVQGELESVAVYVSANAVRMHNTVLYPTAGESTCDVKLIAGTIAAAANSAANLAVTLSRIADRLYSKEPV